MHLCLFEDNQVGHLWPLVATRAAYDLRVGARTLLDTTREGFGRPPTLLHGRRRIAAVTAQEHNLLTNHLPEGLNVLFVNGRYLVEEGLLLERLRRAAQPGEPARVFVQGSDVVAAWVPQASPHLVQHDAVARRTFEGLPEEAVEGATLVGRLWHLLDAIAVAVAGDFAVRTQGFNVYERPGARIHETAVLVEGPQMYVAPGAEVRPGAILSAETGPILIEENAVVMEHAVVRGPVAIGPHAQVKVGASVEDSVVGPWSKVGGEVHGSVVHSFSNKAHPGYLGDSYLGRWCNLGADTNTSNLRNDYGEVTLYDAVTGQYEPTGQQFVGLFMGDHSKSGINTMFNTGTVVGVSCNLFGADLQQRYVPSFSWGSPATGYQPYRLDKALQVAEAVMGRRDKHLTEAERDLLAAMAEEAH